MQKPSTFLRTTLFLLTVFCSLFTVHCYGQAAGNSILNDADYSPPAPMNAYKSAERGYYSSGRGESFPVAVCSNDSTIILDATVLMNIKADSYVAIFGVTQVASTLDSCNELMNNRLTSFIDNLEKLGINKSEIFTDLVSQIPMFTYEVEKKIFSKTYNEVPAGFELRKNVHIHYSDSRILDKILVEGAKNEIYDIVKVDYFINNMEAIYDTLRKTALSILNKKTDLYTKAGVQFNTAMYHVVAEDINSSYPIERYKSYSAFSNASLNYQRKKSLGSITYNQATKPTTVYYNKLAYNSYDTVINPVVIEPVVQFSCSVKMKYVLKKS